MSDLIDRQRALSICDSAIDLWTGQIGEGALIAVKNSIANLPSVEPEKELIKEIKLSKEDISKAVEALRRMPLQFAEPEIIRCKDCKHYYFADNRVPKEQNWMCGYWGRDQTNHMAYCWKAERRHDE